MTEIPTADWSRINDAADRFERAWKQGRRPRIEDYLAEAEPDLRTALLEELLRVERELRRREGEDPGPEEYSLRFSQHGELIRAVFGPGPDRPESEGQPPGSTTTAPVTTGHETGANSDPPPGTFVRYFGDYEIQAEIGRGGMGVVYKARQISLNRPVALKMIRSAALASDDERRRFQNEAEAVAKLDHPHIVPVFEVGEHDGRHYFTMKLIAGPSLQESLSPFAADPKAAARLMVTVAEAVHHAHQRGILHRDLKPSNILLDERGRPHVTDFGLAKRVEADEGLTLSGAVLGTPAYMAPEQAGGKRRLVTTLSDVYGLGAVLYALLTGAAPFGGETALETLDRVRREPPVPPSRVNPKVPRDLEVICLKGLEKDPQRRYASAQAMAEDLSRYLAGEPVSARAAGVVERVAKWARRKPTLAAAYTLGLLALLLGGLGGAAAWQWRAAERARHAAVLARGEAVMARDGERKAREQLAAVEYGRTIEVAYQEWQAAHVPAAVALLDGTRADLRGWEWRYVHNLCHSHPLTLKGHTDIVSSASFSPDGSRVLTGSWDKTAKIWDARSGAELLTLKGHTDIVFSASFSPDGSRIVTASRDKTAKVWDARTGAELLTLKGPSEGVASASFSPDGSRIVTGSWDEPAKVWDARPLTPELWATRKALRVVESLFTQNLPVTDVITRIRHDPTISPDVRDRALALADRQARVHATREIEHLVQGFFDRLLLREDVLEGLRADATLSEPVRAQALALAEHYPLDLDRLNAASWAVVRRPGEESAAYLRALRLAEAVCRLDPNNGSYLNTLGVAQYRAGHYQVALATLTRSDQLNSRESGRSVPADLEFLAMTQFRLGEFETAHAALGRLTEATKVRRRANDPEAQGFLREAEALILYDPIFPADPFAR